PDGIAVGPDDHAALDVRVVGQACFEDEVHVPFGKPLLSGNKLLGHSAILHVWSDESSPTIRRLRKQCPCRAKARIARRDSRTRCRSFSWWTTTRSCSCSWRGSSRMQATR